MLGDPYPAPLPLSSDVIEEGVIAPRVPIQLSDEALGKQATTLTWA